MLHRKNELFRTNEQKHSIANYPHSYRLKVWNKLKKGSNSFVQHWCVSYYWEWLGLLGLPWVAKMVKSLTAMQETQFQFLGQEDPLEKGMAIHSSILAWIIPWTEEPGRLQSMGSQRVGHDWANNIHTHTHTHTVLALPTQFILWISFPIWKMTSLNSSQWVTILLRICYVSGMIAIQSNS